jgi:antibiotic biosynthesis monooxygenase
MRRHPRFHLLLRALLMAIVYSPAVLMGRGEQTPASAPGQSQQAATPELAAAYQKAVSSGFPDLPAALRATPGCLGVETARTASGKQVIFAWFENKQAVLNWYYSEPHQRLIKQFSGGHVRPGGPLTGVPDEGPVLAVASLTIPTAPTDGNVAAATTQIAIELYAPLPGGLAAGGRFAPSSLRVPGLIEVPMAGRRGAQ